MPSSIERTDGAAVRLQRLVERLLECINKVVKVLHDGLIIIENLKHCFYRRAFGEVSIGGEVTVKISLSINNDRRCLTVTIPRARVRILRSVCGIFIPDGLVTVSRAEISVFVPD